MKEKKAPWWLRKRDESSKEEYDTLKQAVPVVNKDYAVISVISKGFVDLLAEHLVPSTLSGAECIGLGSPAEHGDMNLAVYLYDVRENEEMREQGMMAYDESHLQQQPMYLNLYYMLTAYSSGAVRYRQEEEQMILGKVMQTLYANSVLDSETLLPSEVVAELDFRVIYQNISMEEKTKIWNQAGMPYRLSLFYMISPVVLTSTARKETARVKEIKIEYEKQEW